MNTIATTTTITIRAPATIHPKRGARDGSGMGARTSCSHCAVDDPTSLREAATRPVPASSTSVIGASISEAATGTTRIPRPIRSPSRPHKSTPAGSPGIPVTSSTSGSTRPATDSIRDLRRVAPSSESTSSAGSPGSLATRSMTARPPRIGSREVAVTPSGMTSRVTHRSSAPTSAASHAATAAGTSSALRATFRAAVYSASRRRALHFVG